MSRKVPEIFPDIDGVKDGIRASLPVRGQAQWRPIAQAGNYLIGHGGTLCSFGPAQVSKGGSVTFKFKIQPTAQHLTRLWIVDIDSSEPGAEIGATGTLVSIYDDGTDTGTASADFSLAGKVPKSFFLRHDRDSGDGAPSNLEEVSFAISNSSNSTTSIQVYGGTLFEVPKFWLGSADPGVDDDKLVSPFPIVEDATSISEAFQGQIDAKSECYRKFLFGWSAANLGSIVASGTYTNILTQDPYALGRLLRSSDTTRDVQWNARVSVNSITTASLRLSVTSGDSDEATGITNKSDEWIGWRTITIDCDQMNRIATDGGIRGGVRDELTFEAKTTAGSGGITVFGLIVAEDGT